MGHFKISGEESVTLVASLWAMGTALICVLKVF